MTDALIIVTSFAAMLAAGLWLAHVDDRRRHDRTVDTILARRYTQPVRLGAWVGDTFSTAAPVRATRHDNVRSYGADVAVESLAASGCNHEQTAHAAGTNPVAHAGSNGVASLQARRLSTSPESTASTSWGFGDVELLDPRRATTPHPVSGRRRI